MKKSIKKTIGCVVASGFLLWAGAGLASYQVSDYSAGKAQEYEQSKVHHQLLIQTMARNLKQYEMVLERWKINGELAEKIGEKELVELCKREYEGTLADRDGAKELYDSLIAEAKGFEGYLDTYLQKSKKWKNIADTINPFW